MGTKLGAVLKGRLGHVVKCPAHCLSGGFSGGHRRTEINPDPERNEVGNLPEKVAAGIGEDRAPDILQPNGHDRDTRFAGDQLVPAVQFLQRGRAGQRALREETNDVSFRQRINRRFDGRPGLFRADGNGSKQLETPAEQALLVNLVVNEEADRAGAGELQHHGVDVGDMVRQKQDATGGGKRFDSDGGHPIGGATEQTQGKAQQALGGKNHDKDGDDGSGKGIEEELVLGKHSEFRRDDVLQNYGDDAKEIDEEIIGTEDASAALGLNLFLEMGIEGHDKKRAGQAHAEKSQQKEKAGSIGQPGHHCSANQAAGTNGNESDFDLMGGQPGDEKTAANDAQPERSGIDPGLQRGTGAVVVKRSGNLK